MSLSTPQSSAGEPSRPNRQPELAAPPKLNLWPPTIVLGLYFLAVECSYRLELAQFPRFASRMLALLALLVFFLIWGLTRKRFTRGQRWRTLAVMVGAWIVAGLLNDPARNMFAMALGGFHTAFALSIAWLWLTPRRSREQQLAGVKLLTAVTFLAGALLRWDGLDGNQRPQLSWRWTPTAEQRFLQQRAASANSADAEPAADDGPASAAAEPASAAAERDDWLAFRGGEKEAVVTGLKLGDWSQSAPRELWRRRVGPAWSSVIAVGQRLYTQEQRDREEAVVCYDAATGSELWVIGAGVRFDEPLSGAGPRATPTWNNGRIYAFGATGLLRCLSAATGKQLWSHDVLREANGAVPQWGLSVSPLVVDGLVIVFAGGKDGRGLLAFDAVDGQPAWHAPAGTISFCSPQMLTILGVRQIIMHDEASLFSVQVENGLKLWDEPCAAGAPFQPMLQPHRVDESDLIVGWGNGVRRLHLARDGERWSVSEVWYSNRLKPGFNDFFVHKGALYGLDDGILCCVNADDGQRRWKAGRYGFGQLLLLPETDELLVLGETGDMTRVAADPSAHRQIASFKAIDGKSWNHPLAAHGRLVVRNGAEMACFELK